MQMPGWQRKAERAMGRWKGHGRCSADTLAIGHDIRGDGGWVRSHDAGPAKACTIRILGPDSQGAGAKGGHCEGVKANSSNFHFSLSIPLTPHAAP